MEDKDRFQTLVIITLIVGFGAVVYSGFGIKSDIVQINQRLNNVAGLLDVWNRFVNALPAIQSQPTQSQSDTKGKPKTSQSTGSIGVTYNDSFVVSAPTQKDADRILALLEKLRMELYLTYFPDSALLVFDEKDKEKPPTLLPELVRASMDVRYDLSGEKNSGNTWPVDDPKRKFHLCWVTCNPDDVEIYIKHELVHVLINNRWLGKRIPAGAEEVIATQTEGGAIWGIARERYIRILVENKTLPTALEVLKKIDVSSNNRRMYASADYLGKFLISKGGGGKEGKVKLIKFLDAYFKNGQDWDKAAKEVYGYNNMNELDRNWLKWLSQLPELQKENKKKE